MFKSVYLKRLFLSYALLLLPAFLVFTVCTNSLFALQKHSLDTAMQTEMAQLGNQFELKWQALELQSVYISLKEEFAPARMVKQGYDAINAIAFLNDIRNGSSLLTDVFVHYPSDASNLYTATGLSRISTYVRNRLPYPDAAERFLQILQDQGARRTDVLRMGTASGMLICHFPLVFTRTQSDLSVNFLLSSDAIAQELRGLQSGYHREVAFQCGDSATLLFTETANGYRVTSVQYAPMTPESDLLHFDVSSERYAFTLSSRIAPGVLYARVESLRGTIFALLALLLLVVLWIAFFVSERHSRPVRQLAGAYGQASFAGRMDEWSTLRNLLDVTLEENHRMNRTVADARAALCQQAMLLLFHGAIRDRATLNQMLALNGQALQTDGCMVVLIDARVNDVLLQRIARLPECERSCVVTLFDHSALAVLVEVVDPASAQKLRLDLYHSVAQCCAQEGILPPAVCCSRVYDALAQCDQAYIEALFACKARMGGAPGNLVCFEELLSFDLPVASLPQSDTQALDAALQSMDAQAAGACLQPLYAQIEQDGNSYETRIALRYSLLQRVMRAMMELGIEPDDVATIDPTDGELFAAGMQALLQKLLAQRPLDDAYTRVVAYVQENFTKQELTLDDVSAHVGLSKAYISRLFHSKGEQKYLDFLTTLRIREAMRLLAETSLQVKEITRQVGYWDVVSFQKKFKAITGLNPTEYRKQHRKEETDHAY